MKTLYFQSETTLEFDSPVFNHQFSLRYIPPTFAGQQITSVSLQISPQTQYSIARDGFGNLEQHGCIKEGHTHFVYSVQGVAKISQQDREKEKLHPVFKHPSAFTRPSVRMAEFLNSLNLQGDHLQKAVEISKSVFDFMTYQPSITTTATTAVEAFELSRGVCQDYAHVFISLARLAGIPARYANGLHLGEGASHAWAEVYIDGMWVGIDPTHDCLVSEDYIRFCVGRDFGDSALERGVFYGKAMQLQRTFTQVTEWCTAFR